MKILHVAETIKGGVATVMVQLMRAQVKEFKELNVRALVPDTHRAELAEMAEKAVIFRRNGRGVGALLALAAGLGREVWRFEPDIVHLHSTLAGVVGRVVLVFLWPWRRPKVVYCAHGWAWWRSNWRVVRGCYRVVERWLAPVTDAIVCVGQFEKDAGRAAGLPEDKLVLVPNGVPRQPAPGKRAARGAVRVLFVGRFDRQKGFDVLLEAMRRLEDAPVQLTAVGEALAGAAPPARPNIRYTGWLDAAGVAREMARAEVLVMPSRWEGFALVPLEAMSHGLAVVASDVEPLAEVVRHGDTGLLVPVDDAAALAEVLRETPRAAWREMGEAGYARCMAAYTVEVMTAKTSALYRRLAEGGR